MLSNRFYAEKTKKNWNTQENFGFLKIRTLVTYYDTVCTCSTVSSGLNSLAAVVLEDIIKPITRHKHEQLTDGRATFYSKLLGKTHE